MAFSSAFQEAQLKTFCAAFLEAFAFDQLVNGGVFKDAHGEETLNHVWRER